MLRILTNALANVTNASERHMNENITYETSACQYFRFVIDSPEFTDLTPCRINIQHYCQKVVKRVAAKVGAGESKTTPSPTNRASFR